MGTFLRVSRCLGVNCCRHSTACWISDLKLRLYGVATSLLPSTTYAPHLCCPEPLEHCSKAGCWKHSTYLSQRLSFISQAPRRLTEGQVIVLICLTAQKQTVNHNLALRRLPSGCIELVRLQGWGAVYPSLQLSGITIGEDLSVIVHTVACLTNMLHTSTCAATLELMSRHT